MLQFLAEWTLHEFGYSPCRTRFCFGGWYLREGAQLQPGTIAQVGSDAVKMMWGFPKIGVPLIYPKILYDPFQGTPKTVPQFSGIPHVNVGSRFACMDMVDQSEESSRVALVVFLFFGIPASLNHMAYSLGVVLATMLFQVDQPRCAGLAVRSGMAWGLMELGAVGLEAYELFC